MRRVCCFGFRVARVGVGLRASGRRMVYDTSGLLGCWKLQVLRFAAL